MAASISPYPCTASGQLQKKKGLNQIPIIDVICMSHPSILIVGLKNSSIPVIKKDLLADFIVSYRPAGLSQSQILLLENKINKFKANRQSFDEMH